MKKAVFLFVIVASMLNAQTYGKKLAIELSFDRQSYKLGDEVLITARLRNRGDEPVCIYKYLLWGYRGGLVLEVSDASGHKVEPEQLDEDSVIPSTLDEPKSFFDILSQYEWGVVRQDKTSNLFRKPGRYNVRVRYISPVPRKYFASRGGEQWATEDGPVVSSQITVEIK